MGLVGEFGAAVREVKRQDEGAEPDYFVFFGERFHVAPEVGVMPLMEFAAAADSGLDSADMKGLAAMHAMIRDCIPDDEWDRFRQIAKERRASADVLLEVCGRLYEVMSARPTVSPSDSSAGPHSAATSPSSSTSSSRRAALGLVPVDEVAAADLRAG